MGNLGSLFVSEAAQGSSRHGHGVWSGLVFRDARATASGSELAIPEQARVSAEDWLDEYEKVDCLPLPTSREWRVITIAASARLARRLKAAPNHERGASPAK